MMDLELCKPLDGTRCRDAERPLLHGDGLARRRAEQAEHPTR